MKRLHRLLLAWLLMLALPLQGHAGTHLLMCSASAGVHAAVRTAATATPVPPCHAGAGMAHTADEAPPASAHSLPDEHAPAKHGCAACSFVAAMAPGAPPPPVLHAPVSIAIPFRAPVLPSADPSLPDRPPRPVHA